MNATINSSLSTKPKHIFKVVVLGNISVGKTSIIQRVLGNDFLPKEATVGVEFAEIEINDLDLNSTISIQIWDTSGAERYRAVTTSHIRNADAALVVYDISDRDSFNSLSYWIESIKKYNSDNVIIYLIGNKSDLDLRIISKEEIDILKKSEQLESYYEVSAKLNKNIEEMFKSFCKDIYIKNKDFINKKLNQYKKLKERKIQNHKTEKKCCS